MSSPTIPLTFRSTRANHPWFPIGSLTGPALFAVGCAALLSLGGCAAPSGGERAIHLVDRFDSKMIEGSPQSAEAKPAALWDFSHPRPRAMTRTLGWKAGPGVTDLKVVDGRLTGRSTTDFPVIYAERPAADGPNDVVYSLDVRLRVSDGANMSANGMPQRETRSQSGAFKSPAGFPWADDAARSAPAIPFRI